MIMKLLIESACFLLLTTYGEARGEPDVGQRAVVKVMMTRADNKNKTIKEVALRPWQFSMYNKGMPGKVDPIQLFKGIPNVITGVSEWYSGHRLDGADHYHTVDVDPKWSHHPKMTYLKTIGNHKFYRWDG